MVDRTAAALWLVVSLGTGARAAAQPAQTRAAPGDVQTNERATAPANADLRTEYRIRFVRQDTVYLDGGYEAGLKEGMTLVVRDPAPATVGVGNGPADPAVARLVIVGVASTSAVAEVHDAKREVVAGDWAYLSAEALQTLVDQHAVGPDEEVSGRHLVHAREATCSTTRRGLTWHGRRSRRRTMRRVESGSTIWGSRARTAARLTAATSA